MPDQLPQSFEPAASPLALVVAALQSGAVPTRALQLLLPQAGLAKPLQFPSLQHLDEAVAAAGTHARHVEGLKATTLAWAAQSYRAFRSYLTSSREERGFLSGDVQEQTRILQLWIAALRQRGLSRVAINTYWRGLLSAFRWVTRQRTLVNPLLFVRVPRPGRPMPRVLTRTSAEAVLRFVRNYPWRSGLERTRNLAIVGLMLFAGLRRGETIRLENGDVDPDSGTIRIADGKDPTGGKDRTAYMTPQLREILRAYREARNAAKRTHPNFLASLTDDAGISEGPIAKLFHLISRETGIQVSPHALRHTFATLLRQAGVPDRVSMELLGHASLTMLQRYSHVFSEEPGKAAEKLVLDIRL